MRAQDQTSTPPQSPSQDEPKSKPSEPKNNDGIFGVIPNYRTIEKPKPGEKPLTTKEKFKLVIDDSFDPYAYPIAAAFAGLAQYQNDPKSWGQESGGPFTKRVSHNDQPQVLISGYNKKDVTVASPPLSIGVQRFFLGGHA